MTGNKRDNARELLQNLTGCEVLSAVQFTEKYDEGEEDVRYYDVFAADVAGKGKRVFKKANAREIQNYENFLSKGDFPVPRYFGKYPDGEDFWIEMEYLAGDDLCEMTDDLARAAAKSLCVVANAFWQKEVASTSPDGRLEEYFARIERRAAFLQDGTLLKRAYRVFTERQKTCPRTLSNGDLLPFNAVHCGGEVKIIDWGFGGIMPYSLDIARFIAHGTENRQNFPFYMTNTQKKIFVDAVYDGLVNKPPRRQYERDVQLALLNEYVEFVECGEDDGWYLQQATKKAEEILR